MHAHASGGGCEGTPETTFHIGDLHDPDGNRILEKRSLAEGISLFRVKAGTVARTCRPGQFVVVRGDERGERVPLTIADFDRAEGTITLVMQVVGAASRRLDRFDEGERFLDLVGPLGHPSEIGHFGTVACVGGGLGTAPVFPIQRALKEAGNRIISILGARGKNLLFWEEAMAIYADERYITTDDGSAGEKGFVTSILGGLLAGGERIDRVVAIGPPVMMRAVAETTRPHGVPTIVSLNAIMVDGTGMCGGCRVEVGGETKFTCVDGPEFDGHQVNWDLLFSRLSAYEREEYRAMQHQDAAGPAADAEEQPGASADPATAAADATEPRGRAPMPSQDPHRRRSNFGEVALGYDEATALGEAQRCLQCKAAPCVRGCPVGVDIPGFLARLREGDIPGAAAKIKETNALPAICGRVCPQETQCEAHCVLGRKGEPVAIGRLERFVADAEAARGEASAPPRPPATGKTVAVVGAGPAGLTCAAALATKGHRVVVLEALHGPGGVLAYGIPEFRLPKRVVERETAFLEQLGVEFRPNFPVGPSVSVPQLLGGGFDAVFLGTGAGLPSFLGIPGENLKGVYSSNEFLTRINLMKAYRFPEYETPVTVGRRVAVIGGGNVAMDAARSAVRLGAEEVLLVYRRTRAQLPARAEEVEHALEEGVRLLELTAPVALLDDGEGRVRALTCRRMELGEPDDSGRRRPRPVEGSEHEIEADQVVVAIGQGPNPLLTRTWPELKLNARGNIAVDERLRTNVDGVFAGGDIVTGAATVIEAMGAGKRAAEQIDAYLRETRTPPAASADEAS